MVDQWCKGLLLDESPLVGERGERGRDEQRGDDLDREHEVAHEDAGDPDRVRLAVGPLQARCRSERRAGDHGDQQRAEPDAEEAAEFYASVFPDSRVTP